MDEGPDFTMGDLLHDLARRFETPCTYDERFPGDVGAYTTSELASRFGVSRYAVMKEIKALFLEGGIEVTKKKIKKFGGAEITVQAYRSKPKGEGNE